MILQPRLRRLACWLHRFRSTRHLAERIRERHAHGARMMVIEDFDGGGKFRVNLADHIGSHIYWFGSYNLDLAKVLDRVLSPGMVVMDAGANVGEVALMAAHRVAPTGQVFAFEPLSTIRRELQSNLALNPDAPIDVIPQGLSDIARTATVYGNEVSDDAGAVNHGLASLYPQVSGTRHAAETISLTTLDLWASENNPKRIDLIKIDVEGEELSVLKGASEALHNYRPHLVVEVQRDTCEAAGYTPADILIFLKALNYRFFRIRRRGRLRRIEVDDLSRFQNVLCVPE